MGTGRTAPSGDGCSEAQIIVILNMFTISITIIITISTTIIIIIVVIIIVCSIITVKYCCGGKLRQLEFRGIRLAGFPDNVESTHLSRDNHSGADSPQHPKAMGSLPIVTARDRAQESIARPWHQFARLAFMTL